MKKIKERPLVSVVVPTYNNESVIKDCLESIRHQTYKKLEVMVVDGFSKDATVEIARKYKARIYRYGPKQAKRKVFGATFQRNYGVTKARGRYIYYVDADMVLGKKVLESCVSQAEGGCDAIIVPEDSFGVGFWAACKKLERRAYWGDNNIEAPRFIKRAVWDNLGGLDDTLGADDWDMHDRLKDKGYKVCRTPEIVLHNEGNLSLIKLVKKRYLYGRSIRKYVSQHTKRSIKHFFPVRRGFIKSWHLFIKDPTHTLGLIFMRTMEYLAGFFGIVSTFLAQQKVEIQKG